MPVPAAAQPSPAKGRALITATGPAHASADKPGNRVPTVTEFKHGSQSGG